MGGVLLSRGTVAQAITREASAPNSNSARPLPLLAVWATGDGDIWNLEAPVLINPSWQIDQIEAGHHLLPSFFQPNWTMLDSRPEWAGQGSLLWTTYYQDAIARCAALGLPLSFVGLQWEQSLYTDATYKDLTYASNPNVWVSGAAVNAVSAFGATAPWTAIGDKWTDALNQNSEASMLSVIAGWYPNPPKVIWVSNNEAFKEQWYAPFGNDVDSDQHYLDLYSAGASDELKKERLTAGFITRYPLMIAAMRANLNATWQANSKFIAYNAFGPPHFGRFAGWYTGGLDTTTPLRIDANPLMWEGGSVNLYNGNTAYQGWDDNVYSPQIEGCNFPFMLAEALTLNPSFWFEISTWNCNDYYPITDAPTPETDYDALIAHSPAYTPARYAGMSQFTMWLTPPRVVRMYENAFVPLTKWQPYYTAVVATIDRVYTNTTLKTFWRQSTLVANPDRAHPYQAAIPAGYASAERSYLLTTSLDPDGGDSSAWSLTDTLTVYALARVRGTTPNRTWLLYGHAPNGATSATVTVPGYGDVTKTFAVAGSFFLATEGAGVVAV